MRFLFFLLPLFLLANSEIPQLTLTQKIIVKRKNILINNSTKLGNKQILNNQKIILGNNIIFIKEIIQNKIKIIFYFKVSKQNLLKIVSLINKLKQKNTVSLLKNIRKQGNKYIIKGELNFSYPMNKKNQEIIKEIKSTACGLKLRRSTSGNVSFD